MFDWGSAERRFVLDIVDEVWHDWDAEYSDAYEEDKPDSHFSDLTYRKKIQIETTMCVFDFQIKDGVSSEIPATFDYDQSSWWLS